MTIVQERRTPLLHLSIEQVSAAVQSIEPNADVIDFRITSAGRANTNYIVQSRTLTYVLRFYVRSAELCAKERALYALVEKVVPVARLLGTSPGLTDAMPPFALFEFVPGDSFEDMARRNDQPKILTTARALGHVLAALTKLRFEQSGDLIGDSSTALLRVQAWPFRNFYEWCLFETPAAERLGKLRDPLWRLVNGDERRFMDEWPIHVVHGDFNPTNLLIKPNGEVAAVLDWEFAHAGKPWFDIGNLLRARPEFTLPKDFERVLFEGVAETGVNLPQNWRELALFHDLSSACDFLSSTEDKPETHALALRQVEDTLRRLAASSSA